MTVTTTSNRSDHIGDGSTTLFAFTFAIQQSADMSVYLDGTLQLSGYTVAINSNGVGGTVSFSVAPSNDVNVSLIREVDYTQETSLPTETNIPESTLENAYDKDVMLIQQVKEITDRCLKLAIDTIGVDADLPNPTDYPGYVLVANDDGDGFDLKSTNEIFNAMEGGGYGDVIGPVSSTDGGLAAFSGTDGKTLKAASTVSIAQGGTGTTALTNHGVVVAGASALTTVAPGTSGNLLKSNGTDWVSAAPTSGVSKFTTAAQAISNAGGASIAHGLGAVPTFLTARLKCITTDAGYAVGDYVEIGTGAQSPPDSAYFALGADGTNLFYRFYNSATPIQITHKTSGATTSVAIAKWELYVTAYLIT